MQACCAARRRLSRIRIVRYLDRPLSKPQSQQVVITMVESHARSTVPPRYLEALGGADPILSQRKAPKRLKKLLKGLSEKQLAKRPAENKWSIKEVIGHLADGEIINGARLRFVAAQDRPPLTGYDQDAFVARLGIASVETKELLAAFASARALNVALLARLPESAFDRIGIHSERGEESIRTMVTMYAGHDLVHEQQIEAARAALKAAKKARKAEKSTAPEAGGKHERQRNEQAGSNGEAPSPAKKRGMKAGKA